MTRQALSLELGAHGFSIPSSDRRLRRTVGGLAVLWASVWFGSILFLWMAQSWLLFETGESRTNTGPFDRRVFTQASYVTADGLRLEGVWLAHESGLARYWILFCPPAGASIHTQRIQNHLQVLWDLGYNVWAFDYRGFGANGGTPSEQGLYNDASAAYEFLVHTKGVPSANVILAGRSLGASVAIELATRVESAGLLLFSPIDSVPAVAA